MPVEMLSTRELLPCHLRVHALPVGLNKSPGLVVFSEHASEYHLIRMVNASQLVLRRTVSGLSIRIRSTGLSAQHRSPQTCRVSGVPHDHAYIVRAHRWDPLPLGRSQSVASAIQ